MYTSDEKVITRLLMLINPMFLSYTDREKDKHRQHYYEKNRDKVEGFLYQELFGLTYDAQQDDDTLASSQRHLLNAYTTALTGIGKNSFRLCELQGTDFDLTSFDSLYDYDLNAYNYQQDAIKSDFPKSYVDRDYRLYLNHNWVRLLDSKDHFYYSTLSSLSYYLYDALEEVATEIIESLIPYDLVDGDDHGKNVEGGMLWDFKTDAKGLEAELEELQSRNRTYLSETYYRLNDEFHAETTNEIYFEKQDDEVDGPHWNVIVNNAETAKKITFINFLDDCQDYLQSNQKLEHLKEREGAKLKKLLIDAYEDIVKNFDPTVVKLKKKMKIVMSPKALDGLNSLGDDSE
jgi:hypothetical protein